MRRGATASSRARCSSSGWRRRASSCSSPCAATASSRCSSSGSAASGPRPHDDVAIVPLPVTEARVERALHTLRGAALLRDADVGAVARLAAQLAELLLALDRAQPRDRPPARRGGRRRAGRPGGPDMNEIAAKLGEVGLPAPSASSRAGAGTRSSSAAATTASPPPPTWPAPAASVLVLERRERLGGACTLERPFPDQRYSVSPCAYVVGLLDELVIRELHLRRRGFECYVADPNLWVPFEDGTSFGQWLDDDKTQAQPRGARGLARGHRGLLGLRAPLRRDPPPPAHARPRRVARRDAHARRDRGAPARRADDDRHRLRGLHRRRPRRPHVRPAPQGRAVRPGRDRGLRRPEGPRHRVDQAHALPGRPRGPGPGVGLRQGRHGDDQLRDRRRGARRPARSSPPASPSPRSCPARACGSRTAR